MRAIGDFAAIDFDVDAPPSPKGFMMPYATAYTDTAADTSICRCCLLPAGLRDEETGKEGDDRELQLYQKLGTMLTIKYTRCR